MGVRRLQVLEEEVHGEGGFARLRRYRVKHLRDDGQWSEPYLVDSVERPLGVDGVTVLPHDVTPAGEVRVALRRGIRPVAHLGRPGGPLTLLESVAGVLERGEGPGRGLRRRATAELWEEVGITAPPEAITQLGPPVFLSPGLLAERVYFTEVRVALDRAGEGAGDGTPMEQGSRAVVMTLDRALDACAEGGIQDAKTEIGLRRLDQRLHAGRASWIRQGPGEQNG